MTKCGCPCPLQEDWDEMIFKVILKVIQTILWFCEIWAQGWTALPKSPVQIAISQHRSGRSHRWGSQQTSIMLLQHTNRPQCWAAERTTPLSRASEARQNQLCQAPRHMAGMKHWHHTANIGETSLHRNNGCTPFCTHQKYSGVIKTQTRHSPILLRHAGEHFWATFGSYVSPGACHCFHTCQSLSFKT